MVFIFGRLPCRQFSWENSIVFYTIFGIFLFSHSNSILLNVIPIQVRNWKEEEKPNEWKDRIKKKPVNVRVYFNLNRNYENLIKILFTFSVYCAVQKKKVFFLHILNVSPFCYEKYFIRLLSIVWSAQFSRKTKLILLLEVCVRAFFLKKQKKMFDDPIDMIILCKLFVKLLGCHRISIVTPNISLRSFLIPFVYISSFAFDFGEIVSQTSTLESGIEERTNDVVCMFFPCAML